MALFADRVMRREVIIDSSSLMSTVFAAHLLNVCRCGMVVARVLEPRDNLHNTKEMGGFLAALSLAHATSMPQEAAPSVYIYPHRMVPESIEAAEAALKVRESQASISAMNTHHRSPGSVLRFPAIRPLGRLGLQCNGVRLHLQWNRLKASKYLLVPRLGLRSPCRVEGPARSAQCLLSRRCKA